MRSTRFLSLFILLAAGFASAQDSSIEEQLPGARITNETSSLDVSAGSVGVAAAPGRATVVNKCNVPMYLWSVSVDKTSAVHELRANGGQYTERMYSPRVGGVSMKVTKERNNGIIPACAPNIWDCKQTQLEYTLAPQESKVYYDISWVNCAKGQDASRCPGHSGGVRAGCVGNQCPVQHCAPGAFCPHEVYYSCGAPCNTPDPTVATAESRDLVFTLCSG
ncbi:uncharacterized protein JN550_005213 [Neoarthrinium moseri]|uniref:uncharacterized protein n=1 Tax=Neoarthrinium moseri TaxID=1658444 RepID=UPI001FDAE73B|nr:uncharacterized protein JN550_005213 [Neoarthrinium moseri]KAI1870285.1 hypothetical protein JN550_005213 [Neoarthrinium moseri]